MSTEIVTSIEFQMSLLLFIALAGYLVASRLDQSAVIGEILVGIVVGPSLLGLITYTDFVASLAALGAVILLFVIGLEFNLRDILDVRYAVIALAGVIVPWFGGYWLTLALGYGFSSAVFIGTAMTATSIAITANVLREMGMLSTPVARAIIGTAVIDDVLSLMALSITVDVVSGTFSLLSVGTVVAKDVAFILIAGYAGIRFFAPMLERVDRLPFAQRYPEFVFITAMMFAFLFAMGAEAVGISAIIGAFIAGMSFRGVDLTHSHDLKEGAEYLHIIFAAIFFVSLGILVDITALTPDIMLLLVLLTLVAVITKVAGCGIPARLQGMSVHDSLAVGFGMGPRGEVAMIVALIGLNLGLLEGGIYVAIVLMSLITTVITPIVYRNWLFRKMDRQSPG
ncbi:cation:proton antiporter [Methanofollis fontis]|uniref:Cation:proton antiporter n=1 Tax=Methanofollis fontis TaxID=2052832 RepID=A0A483CVB5_9EURY|nr:cation:proton antiporter [Methanofollis fontis]TAJ45437.1 cation:proton antiporter [Methanofollis fontis]